MNSFDVETAQAGRLNAKQFFIDCIAPDGKKFRLLLAPENVFQFVLRIMSHHPAETKSASGYTDYAPCPRPTETMVSRNGKSMRLGLLYELDRHGPTACWPIDLTADEARLLSDRLLDMADHIDPIDCRYPIDR